jgi:hypothetical protein
VLGVFEKEQRGGMAEGDGRWGLGVAGDEVREESAGASSCRPL